MKRDLIQVDLHQKTSHPKQGVLVQFKLSKKQVNQLIVELLPYDSVCARSEAIGLASLGLTIYLYCGPEFPTLGCSQHRDSTKLPFSLDPSILSPFPTSL